jgi:hypothetical protein
MLGTLGQPPCESTFAAANFQHVLTVCWEMPEQKVVIVIVVSRTIL